MKTKLIPLRDYIVLEPQTEKEVTESGIVIPQDTNKDRPEQGTVVAVGPGRVLPEGTRSEMDVKKGDKVLFSKYGPTEVKIDGKDYLVVKQDDILAILQND